MSASTITLQAPAGKLRKRALRVTETRARSSPCPLPLLLFKLLKTSFARAPRVKFPPSSQQIPSRCVMLLEQEETSALRAMKVKKIWKNWKIEIFCVLKTISAENLHVWTYKYIEECKCARTSALRTLPRWLGWQFTRGLEVDFNVSCLTDRFSESISSCE